MELIADGLLVAGALVAAMYCWILSRRLSALRNLDKGLGGAIAGLSARVEQTRASLADTKASTTGLTRELADLTARAEIAAGRLELLLATVHENRAEDPRKARAEVRGRRGAAGDDAPAGGAAPAEAARPPAEQDLLGALRRIAGARGR